MRESNELLRFGKRRRKRSEIFFGRTFGVKNFSGRKGKLKAEKKRRKKKQKEKREAKTILMTVSISRVLGFSRCLRVVK